MSEPQPEYHITMDVVVVTDTWEANLLVKARQLRAEWLTRMENREIILIINKRGQIQVFRGEPSGIISTIDTH